jgi:hypothetical protein
VAHVPFRTWTRRNLDAAHHVAHMSSRTVVPTSTTRRYLPRIVATALSMEALEPAARRHGVAGRQRWLPQPDLSGYALPRVIRIQLLCVNVAPGGFPRVHFSNASPLWGLFLVWMVHTHCQPAQSGRNQTKKGRK